MTPGPRKGDDCSVNIQPVVLISVGDWNLQPPDCSSRGGSAHKESLLKITAKVKSLPLWER